MHLRGSCCCAGDRWDKHSTLQIHYCNLAVRLSGLEERGGLRRSDLRGRTAACHRPRFRIVRWFDCSCLIAPFCLLPTLPKPSLRFIQRRCPGFEVRLINSRHSAARRLQSAGMFIGTPWASRSPSPSQTNGSVCRLRKRARGSGRNWVEHLVAELR
jgi:hypothetical protein